MINDSLLVVVLAQAVLYGTPLLYASLGELLAERSGVLNLGVEGMMLFGAAVGYWVTQRVHGSSAAVLTLAVLGAAAGGAATAAIHAFLTITLRASQIVSGLALTIFAGGLGLSAYFGNELHLADFPATHQFGSLDVLGLGDLPVFGPILFDQSALVYASWVLTALVGALPRAHALRAQRPRGRRGARVGRRDGHRGRALPVRPRARRRRVRRGGRRLLQPLHHAGLGRGRHARERRRLDRDRARHLRLLACRALSRRRVPLRGSVRASVRAAGARRDRRRPSSCSRCRT